MEIADLLGQLADDAREQVARVARGQGRLEHHVAVAEARRRDLERTCAEAAEVLERINSLNADADQRMCAVCERAAAEMAAARDEASRQWRELMHDTRLRVEAELSRVVDLTGLAREEAVKATQAELDDLRGALSAAQAESAAAAQAALRVQKDVQKTLDDSRKAADDTVARVRQRMDTVSEALKKLQKQHESHEEVVKQQRRQIAAQEEAASGLQSRLAALSSELARERRTNEELGKRVQDLTAAVDRLSSKLSHVVDMDLRGMREDIRAVSATLPVRLFLRRGPRGQGNTSAR